MVVPGITGREDELTPELAGPLRWAVDLNCASVEVHSSLPP